LCVLGGANRGRVPANEREGSRTADEPAALTMRVSSLEVAENLEEPASSLLADAAVRRSFREIVANARAVGDHDGIDSVASPRSRHRSTSASPRGPPLRTSMV
jgi:hypothetical protein